jgi:hypothetical protein
MKNRLPEALKGRDMIAQGNALGRKALSLHRIASRCNGLRRSIAMR